ncbi:MAG: MarR family winged helix-turn-helix transcriptional regulator [Lentilactobacillus diolivorans]|jgi:DNA-binding MarR family transcriptional regulator|nr:MarR family winged helix-turn-helix transcriptional regulator [Lentilactobacillus diolivorans]
MSDQIGILVKNLDNDLQRYSSRQAHKLGITQVQMSIIDFLYHNEANRELYQTDVEHEFNIQKSSATSILQGMEKTGLIVRSPSQKDSRYKIILLTAQARQYAEQIRNFYEQTDAALKERLGNKSNTFIDGLQLLRNYLEAQLK